MPTELEKVVEMVVSLRGTTPPSISLERALGLLIEAGMSIDDAAEEIARIEERDYEGASALLDAIGDEKQAAEHLHPSRPEIKPSLPVGSRPSSCHAPQPGRLQVYNTISAFPLS
jgi:hypothetical protein